MTAKKLNGSERFLRMLEKGVTDVMKDDKAETAEKLQAINAGAKLLAIRHKLDGHDDTNFFGGR